MPSKQHKVGPLLVILICLMMVYFMIIFKNKMQSMGKDSRVASPSSQPNPVEPKANSKIIDY